MALRGFTRAVYVDDSGARFQCQVANDQVEDASRGWDVTDATILPLLPRGFLPRRVVGIDDTGRQQSTRVATVEAALWTGTVTTFTVEASDQTTVTATVVLRQQELQTQRNNLNSA